MWVLNAVYGLLYSMFSYMLTMFMMWGFYKLRFVLWSACLAAFEAVANVHVYRVHGDALSAKHVIANMKKARAYSPFRHVKQGTEEPTGLTVSWQHGSRFIAHIEHGECPNKGQTYTVTFVCTAPTKDRLLNDDANTVISAENAASSGASAGSKASEKGGANLITVYEIAKTPEKEWACYLVFARQLLLRPLTNDQQRITDGIISDVSKHKPGNRVHFIHGPSGTGKTNIARTVAAHFGGTICFFDPTRPGENMTDLVNRVHQDERCKMPIVLVLDEIDSVLHQMHLHHVPDNPKTECIASSKTSYNKFADNVSGGWDDIIVIMTSNTSHAELQRSLDPSYLRCGRVHAVWKCTTTVADDSGYVAYEDWRREGDVRVAQLAPERPLYAD